MIHRPPVIPLEELERYGRLTPGIFWLDTNDSRGPTYLRCESHYVGDPGRMIYLRFDGSILFAPTLSGDFTPNNTGANLAR